MLFLHKKTLNMLTRQ